MLTIDIDRQVQSKSTPENAFIELCARTALLQDKNVELAVSIVDEQTIHELNRIYLGKDKPTNVLSFPSEADSIEGSTHLGDIILCAPIVELEAQEQGKNAMAHWAHLTIHGMLHLQNYDHQNEREAKTMEALEVSLLATLDYPNPYL